MNFDDLPDDAPQGTDTPRFDDMPDAQPQANARPVPSFDDMEDQSPSVLGTAARGVMRGAIPATAGSTTGVMAAGAIGAMRGAPAGVPGLIGGAVAGLGAGWLASKGQDWVAEQLGLDGDTGPFSPTQAASDEAAHPYIKAGAEMLPAASPFSAAGGPAARVIGGAMGAGIDVGAQLLQDGKVDWGKALMGGALGAATPGLNRMGAKLDAAGAAVGRKLRPATSAAPGQPGRPDLKAQPVEEATPDDITVANDITTTAQGVAADNPPAPAVEGAGNIVGAPMQGREAARPSDPARDYRKDKPSPADSVETQPSTQMSTAPMHEDIAAALAPEPLPIKTGIEEAGMSPRRPVAPMEDAALEGARTQREALEATQRRMAAQQHGEAFQEPGSTATEPSPAAAPHPPDVTAAVTPQEQHVIDTALAEIRAQGMDKVLAKFEAMPPKQQAAAASKLLAAVQSKSGEATGREGVVRIPDKRPTLPGGMQARSLKDAARKSATLDAVTSTHAEFGPAGDKGKTIDAATADKPELIAYAKQAYAEATKRNGGKDPLVRSKDNYVPVQKGPHTDAYQWLRALKELTRPVVSAKALENFRALHQDNAPEEGKSSVGQLDAETAKIEGEIARGKATLPEAAAETQLAKTREGEFERPTFEPMPDVPEGKDNSYVEAHNRLVDYINELAPSDYDTLAREHNMRAELDEPADPAELLRDLKQTLAASTGKRPPKIEVVPAEDQPARPKKITTAADLPKSGAVKRIDPKSAEGKRIAEQALKSQKVARSDNRLDQEQAALDGSWDYTKSIFEDFLRNEAGGGPVPKLLEWMTDKAYEKLGKTNLMHEYAKQLGGAFHGLTNRITQFKTEVRANAIAAIAQKLTKPEWENIYQAHERGDVSALPQKLQDVHRQFIAPLERAHDRMYDELYALDQKNQLGLDIPERVHGPSQHEFIPRLTKNKQMYDQAEDTRIDAITGRTLSGQTGHLEDRTYFTLHPANPNNPRLLVMQDEPGTWKVLRNGAPTPLKNIPPSFEGKLGDQLTLNLKGQKADYALDHATVSEIKQNAKQDFHENPLLAYSQANLALQKVLESQKLLVALKDDPKFMSRMTRSRADAEAANKLAAENKQPLPYDMEKTRLPQFRDYYMPANLKWAMDDFHRAGFARDTPPGLWDRAAEGAIKTFYTFSPLPHVLNEAQLWANSHGWNWVNPAAYRGTISRTYRAIQSVNSQDILQKQIRDVGGNPMYGAALTNNLLPQIARGVGIDMRTNAKAWDPIARKWNMTTPQLAEAVYDASNRFMWKGSDYFLTSKVLHNMEHYGMSMEDAVADAHKFLSDYKMPETVMGSRGIAQALGDNRISLFSRYHIGLWNTLANMTKEIAHPDSTLAQRQKAVGQVAAMFAMGLVMWPWLEKGISTVSQAVGGHPVNLSQRGLNALTDMGTKIAKGERNPAAIMSQLWAPSIPANMVMQLVSGRDFAGRKIMEDGASAGKQARQLTEWGVQQLVPPYGTIARHAKEGPVAMGRALALEQLGAREKSNAAMKYEAQRPKYQFRDMKKRDKNPRGLIE